VSVTGFGQGGGNAFCMYIALNEVQSTRRLLSEGSQQQQPSVTATFRAMLISRLCLQRAAAYAACLVSLISQHSRRWGILRTA
jgi:hypothetical protein